eukprot:TRINITY_DN24149_c0_g1_i1.p3 TRINITY_DN24149_c0_g1~~TRINITY_DN24149_c0_g1_i1.p3  ORF type:complete len:106 (+),score=30.77 TRINITY_DN24149_c0_g1_i1:599-916(+)
MVYIEVWDEFAEKAELLFRANPARFRYTMKYRHKEGVLALKATDDRVCLQFKTDQAQDAKKMEKLNVLFFTLMAKGPDAVVEEIPEEKPVVPAGGGGKKGRGRRQ